MNKTKLFIKLQPHYLTVMLHQSCSTDRLRVRSELWKDLIESLKLGTKQKKTQHLIKINTLIPLQPSQKQPLGVIVLKALLF